VSIHGAQLRNLELKVRKMLKLDLKLRNTFDNPTSRKYSINREDVDACEDAYTPNVPEKKFPTIDKVKYCPNYIKSFV
jgi:hypothetical protein